MQLNIDQIEQENGVYTLNYKAGGPLPFTEHDIVLLHADGYFIGSIIGLTSEQLRLSVEEEGFAEAVQGSLEMELAFSPAISIEGGPQLVQELGGFPSFHKAEITKAEVSGKSVKLALNTPNSAGTIKEVIFTFQEVSEQEFTPLADRNIIEQIDFRYDGGDMVVDIEGETGLSGSLICGGIRAEVSSNE
ncbi:Imm50 family immunity protein [Paenibacillus sp. JX-17]|uniref:Imm50 family immunity protein n=1 Tax=Paenibacillus lacisoli TaxID=3064525 RepID=A0ABT9C722_9BACL|nr:Imm50 family immunity protein [Paenibacillus sp. JX-17]MDO7905054.1 Imm50 family immunity protein [Paenibacillus sp. JX-17]